MTACNRGADCFFLPVWRAAIAIAFVGLPTIVFGEPELRAAQAAPRAQSAPVTASKEMPDQRYASNRSLHSTNIVADNLDRVAATAPEILEVLAREAGMMVEFKRLLARDAGENGQLLDESDLSDDAIAERLNTDLHSRVLATRLLQRYGYLLAKPNPESDVAFEHRLVLQQRAIAFSQSAGPATETRNTSRADLSTSDLADEHPHDQNPTAEPAPESYPPSSIRPEPAQSSQVLRTTELSSETLPGALAPAPSAEPANPESYRSSVPLSQPQAADAVPDARESAPGRTASPQAAALAEGPDRTWYERTNPTSKSESSSDFAIEPVRMVHLPNPYAEAPSLYDLYVQASPATEPTERFGLKVFQRGAANPGVLPIDLPVGPDYVVGPGDGLSIDLWGGVAQRLVRTVDREGRLLLPEAGPLLVSGKSLGEVQQAVQRVLRTQFRDVSADISLLRLRTVRVYVVGEVTSPGAYDVSSLSTPLNALIAAGGVTPRGSLRTIEHFRGNARLEEVDLYDLLLHGVRGDMQRLENGDSLRVPPLGSTVTVEGMVRRPATYELHGESTLNEVLDLAGGILPAAALRHIEVQRMEAHTLRTMLSLDLGEAVDKDSLRAAFEKFHVQDADVIHIFPIAPYNSGAVYLEGHVLRPGRYSYRPGMKLTDLIPTFNDLLPEPADQYAEIVRIASPDFHPVVKSFDLAAALKHPESAPTLEPLDTVRIFGRYDLEGAPEILVTGEVRAPGRYRTSGSEHLRDALYHAGGVTPEAWLDSAQLFRGLPNGSTKLMNISLRAALDGDPLNNILVEPRDRILIHRQPEIVSPASVSIRGEVGRPGRYPLVSGMRVSDLVRSAGGLLRSAEPSHADLVHFPDSSAAGLAQPAVPRTIDLVSALDDAKDANLPLHDGDVLTVPERAGWKDIGASATLHGEVARPGVYGIEPGERLSSLLRRAGGLLPTAYPQAAVFERIDVRRVQEQTRQDLIQRLEQDATVVKASVNTSGTEEAALQQSAIQQRQRLIDALRRAPVSGRLVVQIRKDQKSFVGSSDDIELRAGDTLEIPKQPGYVLVVGQVYNSNAITFTPGKNAAWYLSRAGGATGVANKKAIFILRASGSVTSASGGLWSGGVLSSAIGPGDTIVVPERAVVGGSVWKNLVAIAQIAQAGALAAAVAIP